MKYNRTHMLLNIVLMLFHTYNGEYNKNNLLFNVACLMHDTQSALLYVQHMHVKRVNGRNLQQRSRGRGNAQTTYKLFKQSHSDGVVR